ncbi:MBL fold metallo-hydrolase [soil metagenome]
MLAQHLVPVMDEGLGNSTYLLDIGQGRALVVDPSRDLRQVRAEAHRLGLVIAYAAETHLHADFISGVHELEALDGATVLSAEVGPRDFVYVGLNDGDGVEVGAFTLRALATPGHSPEHLSYLLLEEERIVGVFTGGSLMVGTAGRTDLVSRAMTVPLARAQYHSLQRLMKLPDSTPVWPTHGAGSFCSAAAGNQRTSTIGRERATNPLLHVENEDTFVDLLLGSLGTFPDYFLRLGEINRQGPVVLGQPPTLVALSVAQVQELQQHDAQIVDARPPADFAAGHIPGSLSIALRPMFATWLGWLADPDLPVIIVRNKDQNLEDIAFAAAKVGFDALAGELGGGFQAWRASAESPTAAGSLIGARSMVFGAEVSASVIDIRQASEYAAGHVAAAYNFELGSLAEHLAELPAGPLVVMCGHSERAMSSASILERAGRTDVSVLDGSATDWTRESGQPLETGP